MSAIIEREFDFQACVYFQNTFLVNLYNFIVTMEVETDSIHEQNIAMDRLKYLVYETFENTIFIQDTETDVIKKYQDAGLKVCMIPDEPYDQIMALLIMLKFESVCEGRLKISEIIFTSKLSDQVKFRESILTAQNTFADNGWWNNSGPALTIGKKNNKEKIVKMKNNEWKDCGLIWKEPKEKPTEIVFSIDPDK